MPKYKKPRYILSIFFMLLNIPPFLHLLLSSFARLQSTGNRNRKWKILAYLKNSPTQVCDILKTSFSKAIGRYEPKHPPKRSRSHTNAQKAICGNLHKHYLTSIIHTILSVINDFITELLFSAIYFDLIFSSLEKQQSPLFSASSRKQSFPRYL